MMFIKKLLFILITISAIMLAACDDSKKAVDATEEVTKDAVDATKDAAKDATDAVKEAMEK